MKRRRRRKRKRRRAEGGEVETTVLIKNEYPTKGGLKINQRGKFRRGRGSGRGREESENIVLFKTRSNAGGLGQNIRNTSNAARCHEAAMAGLGAAGRRRPSQATCAIQTALDGSPRPARGASPPARRCTNRECALSGGASPPRLAPPAAPGTASD